MESGDDLTVVLAQITYENQRFMAERMKARMRSHPVDHVPIVTAPAAVVEIICEAITAVVTGLNAGVPPRRRLAAETNLP